jgi:2OG-Fe(II) oxygenase superfamily
MLEISEILTSQGQLVFTADVSDVMEVGNLVNAMVNSSKLVAMQAKILGDNNKSAAVNLEQRNVLIHPSVPETCFCWESVAGSISLFLSRRYKTPFNLRIGETQLLSSRPNTSLFFHYDQRYAINGDLMEGTGGRDVSAIIYLNDFQNGELYFGVSKGTKIKPVKGKLVFWVNSPISGHGALASPQERKLTTCFFNNQI